MKTHGSPRRLRRPTPALANKRKHSWSRFRYFCLLGFMVACLLGGGAARPDVLSLLYLRPISILCLAGLLFSPGTWDFRRYRDLFILLALFAAIMLVQIIPLPPEVWTHLPGHARFLEASAAAGFAQPWRPISLAPDLTLNSIFALMPCLIVLVGFAGLQEDQRRSMLPVLIAFICFDAAWSILQFVGGRESATYLYQITNNDYPVGIFSNRNHHALLLAAGFPMLALWASTQTRDHQRDRVRRWVALAIALLLIPMILATGSRAGLILGGVSLGFGYWLAPSWIARVPDRWRHLTRAAGLLIPVLLIGVTIFANRALSLDRLTGMAGLADEQRVAALPVLTAMLKEFGAPGIGFGAFDPAFRIFEPDAALQPFYFNHAHNDLLELVLAGGWISGVVLLLLLLWVVKNALTSFQGGRKAQLAAGHARLGAIIIALLFGASLVDYPLRTPLLAVVFTIAAAWLAPDRRPTTAPDAIPNPRLRVPRTRRLSRRLGQVALALLFIGLGWVMMGVTAARSIGQQQPSLVAGWWPFDAEVNAAAAATAVQQQGRGLVAREGAGALARASLSREPVNVEAVRTLALLAAVQGDSARTQRLMSYSESLSRRDLPTQLWLIENRVQANDIQGALAHYDRALRSNPEASGLLFPILLQAAESRDVLVPLARLIARRPSWWRPFSTKLASEGSSPLAIETIIEALGLDVTDVAEHGLQVTAIGRLIELGSFDRAIQLYQRAQGAARQSPALVHNGNFETENRFPPIEWVLADGVNLAGIMEPDERQRNNQILLLVAQDGASGEIARQLVALGPGRYRFSATAGNIGAAMADQPTISLNCARTGESIFQLRLPQSPPDGRNVVQDFVVGGASCPAEWLTIHGESPHDPQESNPWIDQIAIAPLPNGA